MTSLDTGDTAWILICAAFAFLMAPGIALFYGRAPRDNEDWPALTPYLTVVCLALVQWIFLGYSLSLGPDHGGWIGTLARTGLRDVSFEPNLEYAGSVPHLAFMLYHGMLALFPLLLILSACAERVKFGACCFFLFLWMTLVYDPVAHWIWGVGGFLRVSGALDFAGGIPIHLSAGVTALMIALCLGKRKNVFSQNLSMAAWGAYILWFAWPILNAGSALMAGGLAANAFVMTHAAAIAAALAWAVMDGIFQKHPTPLGMLAGLVSGLVAITPAAGYVNLIGAICTGVGAAGACYGALVFLKKKRGQDIALDIFGIHGIGGIWGMMAAGLWAAPSVNPNGMVGFFYGNPALVATQIKATLATTIYISVVSCGLLLLVDRLVGLRVSSQPVSET